jgi:outer membrane protein assembly factor BamB
MNSLRFPLSIVPRAGAPSIARPDRTHLPSNARRSARAAVATLALLLYAASLPAAPADDAQRILATSGVKGGLVVQLGLGDAALTSALRANNSYQVVALDADAKKVAAAREAIFADGKYGPVSVEQFTGAQLPFIDNLVNLLVAENLGSVPRAEALRVLVPNGVLLTKSGGQWQKTVKPKDPGFDDWTHYFYDAKGNTTSKDTFVAPPERLQWVGSPRWSRHHDRMSSLSAQVSSAGRLFYIMDEGSRISILLPAKWHLIARDAFNGTPLWKLPIASWNTHLWPLKSGPTQLTRRLVADGERVFVTLGIEAPISCLDGATGQTLFTCEGSRGAEEFVQANGVVYALINPRPWVLEEFAVKQQSDQKRVETEYNWDKKPRDLAAFDAKTGKLLWRKADQQVAPITIACDGTRLVYHDGDVLVSLDPKTGAQQWASEKASKRTLFEFNYSPRVLLAGNTVLYAGGDGAQRGVDAATGRTLWQDTHEKSGYRSPEDLIVAGGLVWNAGTLSGNQKGEFKGRDLRTGAVKKQFSPDVPDGTYWFHHRCYIAKATEKYLIPSRTGIEFVDHAKEHWDLNHWVRAACLYGVMPANGLTYAGPHNCACYPEAKLDGLNAMAGGQGSPHPIRAEATRLVKGPAFNDPLGADADAKDWPTYRHDAKRSGSSDQPLLPDLAKAWEVKLGGPLSALTIAGGKVFVAQVDAHTVHALDHATGLPKWHFIAGGRVDSPPTYWKGRVYFGGKDGVVYCLRASDGALVWKYHGAPGDRRHCALEQVESVWPVHGSVLVEDGKVSFVAGRSVFLDNGLRFVRLDATSGRMLTEQTYNHVDPETGKDFNDRHKTLQMPVGLNDILSSDGKWTYLRTQKIAADGKRVDIGPVSNNAIEQGAAQKGEGAHLFAPMGFLDDSWFHRSYWVYGKSFAGGHNGYYQAGKYTPSGRIIVHDDKNVYGYGREAQYFKWTTTMEHQLMKMPKDAPGVAPDLTLATKAGKQAAKQAANAAPAGATPLVVTYPQTEKNNIAGKPFTLEIWALPDGKDGVLISHGGPQNGAGLVIEQGKVGFVINSNSTRARANAPAPLLEGWHHIVGVLEADKTMKLYLDGQIVAQAKSDFVAAQPKQPLRLGGDGNNNLTGETLDASYTGMMDQFAVYTRALTGVEIQARLADPTAKADKSIAQFSSFDKGDARDEAGQNHGVSGPGIETGKGRSGAALWFRRAPGAPAQVAGKGGKKAAKAAATTPSPANPAQPNAQPAPAQKGTFVQNDWQRYVPIITRAMAKAGNSLIVSGAEDLVDEEYAFERLAAKDKSILQQLQEQDDALEGKRGAKLWAVAVDNGNQSTGLDLASPPVWDGMAVAQGRLYVSSLDGVVRCFGKAK